VQPFDLVAQKPSISACRLQRLHPVTRMTLRKFGYASDSKSATQPINTQKMSQSFIQRTKKKK